ncbi:hypothetical protein CkaCkLH20_09813 [Colletotrichum karsti]|uniref:NACHT-NTPase and P-loop NTPases N-terminal domain-containing protein n=1 Tax=Colletotrichum karsti TaxID=1095194 RepID=A0A9P6HY93_9PEZI|nr:uncharacterized protein CkaCkLH20_09813 [Colletotrichum karsti]KAF9872634.1 hypothetical protein CkaCkLH20_09813 [Colletotrichum karsti]
MDPLTITTSVVTLIGAISASYDTVGKIKDLPKAFDEVKKSLPIVQKVLEDTRKRLQTVQTALDDHNKQLVIQTVQQCEEKATILRDIFDKLERKCKEDRDADTTWSKAKAWYREALRGMKAHRVETLMKDIMGRIKALAMNELLSLHDDVDVVSSALAELSHAGSSLEDWEFEMGGNHATQVNESGAHGQQNNTQGGSHVMNSGYNVSGSNHTFHFGKG